MKPSLCWARAMRAQIGAAVFFVAAATTGAAAETYQKYGSEAGWDIYISNGQNRGCLMTRNPTPDTQFQMGIVAGAEPRGYLALYTKEEAAITAGEEIAVVFDVDGEQFLGEATGRELMEGYKGAFAWVNNPLFIYDLAKKNTLTITPMGRDPIALSLAGTNAALQSLRSCQDAQ